MQFGHERFDLARCNVAGPQSVGQRGVEGHANEKMRSDVMQLQLSSVSKEKTNAGGSDLGIRGNSAHNSIAHDPACHTTHTFNTGGKSLILSDPRSPFLFSFLLTSVR